MDPPAERNQQQRAIKQPMRGLCGERFEFAIRVQFGRFGLADGPTDAGQSDEENGHAEGFVQREQKRLAGQLFGCVIGLLIGDDTQRD